jgi:hypothetical protein
MADSPEQLAEFRRLLAELEGALDSVEYYAAIVEWAHERCAAADRRAAELEALLMGRNQTPV